MPEVIDNDLPVRWTITRCFEQLGNNFCFRRYEQSSLYVFTKANIIVNYGIVPGSSTRINEVQWYYPFKIYDILLKIEKRKNKIQREING
jgi:hypothetical protein